ncbi:hypothetical protein LTR08_004146 [Meristemomyces frigidus]|nr:hypothetical protein LTR08_004146 [Meristemomyces frigidus]
MAPLYGRRQSIGDLITFSPSSSASEASDMAPQSDQRRYEAETERRVKKSASPLSPEDLIVFSPDSISFSPSSPADLSRGRQPGRDAEKAQSEMTPLSAMTTELDTASSFFRVSAQQVVSPARWTSAMPAYSATDAGDAHRATENVQEVKKRIAVQAVYRASRATSPTPRSSRDLWEGDDEIACRATAQRVLDGKAPLRAIQPPMSAGRLQERFRSAIGIQSTAAPPVYIYPGNTLVATAKQACCRSPRTRLEQGTLLMDQVTRQRNENGKL